MVCAVDDCHFHIGAAQGLRGKEPSESASNDGHSMAPHAGTIALFVVGVWIIYSSNTIRDCFFYRYRHTKLLIQEVLRLGMSRLHLYVKTRQ